MEQARQLPGPLNLTRNGLIFAARAHKDHATLGQTTLQLELKVITNPYTS